MPYGTLALDAISTSGNLTVTGNLTANTHSLVSQTLGTATPGRFEYDGRVPYFTPAGTQRGVIPGQQFYAIGPAGFAGASSTSAQPLFGVGATLSGSTQYFFECSFNILKPAGSGGSGHFFVGFGGTATINTIGLTVMGIGGASFNTPQSPPVVTGINRVELTQLTTATQGTGLNLLSYRYSGVVSINGGGTFIPQYATGVAVTSGVYTTQPGSYFLIYPIGAAGSNINVGTWA